MDMNFLNDEDVKTLRQMFRWYKSQVSKTEGRLEGPSSKATRSPSTYLAKIGTGDTLAALSTGTNLPGNLECEIYQPGGIDGTETPAAMGFTALVLNYTTGQFTEEQYVPVVKDQYGYYLACGAAAAPPAGDTSCCCELLDLLENSLTLTSPYNSSLTIGERIGQLQSQNNCSGESVPCDACADNEAPSPLYVTLTGVSLDSGAFPLDIRRAFFDWINKSHAIVLGEMPRWNVSQFSIDGPRFGGLPNLNENCFGRVVEEYDVENFIPGVPLAKFYMGLGLERASSDIDGLNGRWGISIAIRWGDTIIENAFMSPSSTPGSALWNADCTATEFGDQNDLTYTPNTDASYFNSAVLYSAEVRSQQSTPPPPPPE